MEQHFIFSSFREKLIEHLFISEMLKASWQSGECSLEVARPEVDSRGYDLIVERNGVVRHIQLKASHQNARASSQKIHLALENKPSGCVVWVIFDEKTLELGPFLYFGAKEPGLPLPTISNLKVAKHVKADMQGIKAERANIRVVAKSRFVSVATAKELFETLFGVETDPPSH